MRSKIVGNVLIVSLSLVANILLIGSIYFSIATLRKCRLAQFDMFCGSSLTSVVIWDIICLFLIGGFLLLSYKAIKTLKRK
jgi:hypothetical protein